MRSLLLFLVLLLPTTLCAQGPTAPIDSSRTTFTIFLRDGGQYVGRIVERDSIKVVVRRQGGGLSYLAPADITRIEPYRGNVRTRGRNLVNITLTDGSIYTGEITQQDSLKVVLRRRGGESILSSKEIRKIEPVLDTTDPGTGQSVDPTSAERPQSISRFENNQFPWLLYNQTGMPLKAGQLTYRNIWFLYNEISYGLLSFLTVRASVTPSFFGQRFFEDAIYTRPSLGAKLSIPLGSTVRVGADLGYQWNDGRQYNFFINRSTFLRDRVLTGFLAFGSTKGNLTLGYTNSKPNENRSARNSMDIGFVAPIGRRLSLVSDNRILLGARSYDYERFSQISGVLRLNRPRHAFDLGVLVAMRDEDRLRFYPMPYIAFNTRLSRR
ncbi:MAG: hypothetical protein EAZ91_00455 [Cytophagales bacterium]|nr:MAG: hypothetical protein EAZ91_00455 [Cytophagales bacterium]